MNFIKTKIGEGQKPKRKWDYLVMGGLGLILLPFIIVGICKAYDDAVLSSLENSLNANVAAVTNTKKACDASYTALKAYKQEAKIQLVGAGSPCGF